MSDSGFIVECTIKIARNGDITNDTVTHGNSFADVYRAFHQIKAEVDRQIAERRQFPFNPATAAKVGFASRAPGRKTHGHVTPNSDGSKARCGGPTLCGKCAVELALKRRENNSADDENNC